MEEDRLERRRKHEWQPFLNRVRSDLSRESREPEIRVQRKYVYCWKLEVRNRRHFFVVMYIGRVGSTWKSLNGILECRTVMVGGGDVCRR